MKIRGASTGVALLALCACGGGGTASGGAAAVPKAPAALAATATPTPKPSTTPLATATPAATVTVDLTAPGSAISRDLLGASLATWYDITQPFVESSMASTGFHLVRWPGGSESDAYHWQTNSVCNGQGYANPASTFDAFSGDVVKPAKLDVAVTLNYGSNAACNAGGDPAEAAAWVAYAKAHGDDVRWWTVGNEEFGSWEYDLHAKPHDPATYASAVATGYYPQVKAADPSAKVGVVVGGSSYPAWDQTVLKSAKYDFVEFHYYAQAPGSESDGYLLGKGVTDFASAVASLRTELTQNGVSTSVPIYVGELNSVYANPGKQTVSIVNGLFAGMAVAELTKQSGVSMATWWLAYGGCNTGTNDSSSLYGWQNFGAYPLFSDGGGECGSNIPAGTPFPDARAYALLTHFAPGGSVSRSAVIASGVTNMRAYAATSPSGAQVLLFNLNDSAPVTVGVRVEHATKTSFTATQLLYGRAQYDASKSGAWPGTVTQHLGTVGTQFSVTLPPWSMNVVVLQ